MYKVIFYIDIRQVLLEIWRRGGGVWVPNWLSPHKKLPSKSQALLGLNESLLLKVEWFSEILAESTHIPSRLFFPAGKSRHNFLLNNEVNLVVQPRLVKYPNFLSLLWIGKNLDIYTAKTNVLQHKLLI